MPDQDGTPPALHAPVEVRKPKGPRQPPAGPGRRWQDARDEFVHSLENGGGVSLKAIARKWGHDLKTLRRRARGKPLPEGGYEPGTSWRELRQSFLDRIWRESEDRVIKAVADRHAQVEAASADVAGALVARTARWITQQGKDAPGVIKSDAEAARVLDVANQVQRRNVGLPERSHEVRGRVEFVRMLFGKFVAIVQRYERNPETVRAIAMDMRQLEEEVVRDESPLAAASGIDRG